MGCFCFVGPSVVTYYLGYVVIYENVKQLDPRTEEKLA